MIALFGAGAVRQSFLTRLPQFTRRLGPVAAPSFSVASRIVNSIKAGHPVKEPAEFGSCRLVVVCVPESAVSEAVCLLESSNLGWEDRTVLLCNSRPDSRALRPLYLRGASTGSLNPVEGVRGVFVVEGERLAVKHAKELLRDVLAQVIELDASGVALYRAGISLGSTLLTPLIAASIECLAAATGNSRTAAMLAHAVFERTLRSYGHSGKKSWTGAVAGGDHVAVDSELGGLEAHRPEFARLYRELAAFGLESFSRHPELLDRLKTPAEVLD